MRYGGTPTAVVGGVETENSEAGTGPPPGASRWRRRGLLILGVVGILAVAGLVWSAVRGSSKPSVSKADVGKIVDGKVGKAVGDLKAEPPPGVAIFNQVRPEMVIVESAGANHAKESSALGSGVIINAQGQILTALHVVQDTGGLNLTFADGTQSKIGRAHV